MWKLFSENTHEIRFYLFSWMKILTTYFIASAISQLEKFLFLLYRVLEMLVYETFCSLFRSCLWKEPFIGHLAKLLKVQGRHPFLRIFLPGKLQAVFEHVWVYFKENNSHPINPFEMRRKGSRCISTYGKHKPPSRSSWDGRKVGTTSQNDNLNYIHWMQMTHWCQKDLRMFQGSEVCACTGWIFVLLLCMSSLALCMFCLEIEISSFWLL